MRENNYSGQPISRRDLFKLLGIGAAAATVPGCGNLISKSEGDVYEIPIGKSKAMKIRYTDAAGYWMQEAFKVATDLEGIDPENVEATEGIITRLANRALPYSKKRLEDGTVVIDEKSAKRVYNELNRAGITACAKDASKSSKLTNILNGSRPYFRTTRR